MITIADLVTWRRRHERLVERVAVTALPTEFGTVHRLRLPQHRRRRRARGARARRPRRRRATCSPGCTPSASPATSSGRAAATAGRSCRRRWPRSSSRGPGVVVYLRGHEGRGIGLLHKLQAYALQDTGRDTVDANLDLGLPADARDYGTGAQVLTDLGVRSVRLLTNNPAKTAQLDPLRHRVAERVPVVVQPTEQNLRYLRTKAERMGHDLAHVLDRRSTPSWTAARERRRRAREPAARPGRRRRAAGRGGRGVLARPGDGRAGRRRAAAARRGWGSSRPWCGCRDRSSCRWSPRRSRRRTTRWSRSAW